MMAERFHKNYLSLTGGLGNQLFQLAAAMAYSKSELEIITYLGAPRLSKEGVPDLFDYQLPESVSMAKIRKGDFLSGKVAGYTLRMGLNPTGLERIKPIRIFLIYIAEIFLSFKIGTLLRIRQSKGVGYSVITSIGQKALLIGYFQSYRWADTPHVSKDLRAMKLENMSPDVRNYESLAKIEYPLAVHVRLGDYKSETSIGILPAHYYGAAISSLLASGDYGAIWLFSDELDLATEVIPKDLTVPVRLIPMIDESSAATLEVMRFCKGYVIANSTFSWWGAFLSYTENAKVIAPRPWFRGIEDPIDLMPPHWILQET